MGNQAGCLAVSRPLIFKAMFYNTINEKNPQLSVLRKKTDTQEQKILKFFEKNKDKSFTPADVERQFNYPITSIRRAMTNLTKQGYLIKTERKSLGKYGVNNYTWRLFKTNQYFKNA